MELGALVSGAFDKSVLGNAILIKEDIEVSEVDLTHSRLTALGTLVAIISKHASKTNDMHDLAAAI